MTLKVDDNKSIATIQQEFNAMFPYLKLEFFKHVHGVHQGSPKKDMLNSSLALKQFAKKHVNGIIEIKETMKVSDLESSFQMLFSLSVQVFRKSAGTWIETSVTDDWTLRQQNDEGKDLSDFMKSA
ncbi:MAG TPA: hypothetical protein VNX01_10660 [Bacteroidia bacterium]|nr:hypothetical protein [Bacteroidia bacterium]